MRLDRFRTGWNDTAYGIMEWTPHDQWPNAAAWATHLLEVVESCFTRGDKDDGYYAGVISAVSYYRLRHSMERLD